MSIVNMEHITVVGLRRDRDRLLQALAAVGAVDIDDASGLGKPESSEYAVGPLASPGAAPAEVPGTARAEEAVSRLESLIALCGSLAEAPKKRAFASRRRVSAEEYRAVVAREKEIWAFADRLTALRSRISEERARSARTAVSRDLLLPWSGVAVDLSADGTRTARIWLGTLPAGKRYEDFTAELADRIPASHVEVLSSDSAQVRLAVVVLRSAEDEAQALIKAHGITPIPVQGESGRPDGILSRLEAEIASLSDSIAEMESESARLAAIRPDFEVLYDHYLMELERLRAAARLRSTREAFVLSGWIPASLGAETERGLLDRFKVAVERRRPLSGEDVPVMMRNIPLVRPYEVITTMFSTPQTSEIDPNPLMAPFFFILFGMMLNDAGYGLLLAAGCALLVWKFKVRGTLRSMCLLLMQGGLSAILSGLLFGGFFGNIVSVVSNERAAFPTLWFNPLEDPVRMMVVSMGLGVLHVFTGMGAKAYMLIRDGKALDAVLDVGSWYALLIGAGLVAVGGTIGNIGAVMALAGAATIILFSARSSRGLFKRIFKGLYNLYGITGYFSDILSYTRILALGLAGGVIAMVVNMIGSIAGFGLVGLPLFIVVALGGHALNIALSALGAYVHTSRLHYVEFFSKFFEGGGRPWTPFSARTRYTEIE